MLDPEERWIVRSHIGWAENETFFINAWKPPSRRRMLKNLEGKLERESPKRTVSASNRLWLLQLIYSLLSRYDY